MSDSCCYLILNGKSAGREDVREAVQTLRAEGAVIMVRVTWEQGDTERYVDEALAVGAGTVIAGGGDGTVNAVVNVLASDVGGARPLPAIGILPLGTANDFATSAGLPLEPLPALRLACAGVARSVDVLEVSSVEGRYWCINVATGGFGTEVTVATDDGLKKRLGGAAYVLTGLSRLGGMDPLSLSLRGEDFAWQGRVLALGVGNGRQAGGGQKLCPDALIDDGLLDVTLLPEARPDSAPGLAQTLGTLFSEGARGVFDRVTVGTRGTWIEIGGEQAFTLNLDGEPVQSQQFRIECRPARLQLRLPPDSPLLR